MYCGAFLANAGIVPGGLNYLTKYWMLNWNSMTRTGQLSLTKNGTAVNITSVGSAADSNYYHRPYCIPAEGSPKGIKIRGLYFYDGGSASEVLRVGGNGLPIPALGPQVDVEQIYMTGDPARFDRPINGFFISDGAGSGIRDSVIEHIFGPVEGHGIGIANTIEYYIINNRIEASGINILTGGSETAALDNNRRGRILGNLIQRAGDMHYREGHGAPTGACFYNSGKGAYYRDVDVSPNTSLNGASYRCTSGGTWVQDTGMVLRTSESPGKNLLELKSQDQALIQGNVFRGVNQNITQGGQGVCFGISALSADPTVPGGGGPYTRVSRVAFLDNWGDRCRMGIFILNNSYAVIKFDGIPSVGNVFENNLLTRLNEWPALCQTLIDSVAPIYQVPTCDLAMGTSTPSPFRIASAQSGLYIRKNTTRGFANYGLRYAYVFVTSTAWTPSTFTPLRIENNLHRFTPTDWVTGDGAFMQVLVAGSPANCTAGGDWANYGDTRFTNEVFSTNADAWGLDLTHATCTAAGNANNVKENVDPQFEGLPTDNAQNSALQATSPYSASFASHTALSSDGTDVGYDAAQNQQYTYPALTGLPPMAEQMGFRGVRIAGNLNITLSRSRGATCTAKAYNSPARIAANQIGSTQTSSATPAAFSFTSLSGTVYHEVECASMSLKVVGSTQ